MSAIDIDLRQRLPFAKRKQLLPTGQSFDLSVPKSLSDKQKERRKVAHMTFDQWKKMREFINKVWVKADRPTNEMYRRRMFATYFNLMVETGMRMQAAQNLKWKDVYPEEDSVRFVVRAKGHEWQPVGPPELKYLLESWRMDPDNKWTADHDHVFVWKDGSPPNDQQLDMKLKQVQLAAEATGEYSGISYDESGRRINCNSFRHTYAVMHRWRFGTKIEDIAENMGNSIQVCFRNYAHVQPRDIKDRLSSSKVCRRVRQAGV